jgi:hypothetical protein
MSERTRSTEAIIDELIGKRPEEIGAFMGLYPAVERQRGWTIPDEGPVRLIRSRFLMPGRPNLNAFDTLFHLNGPECSAITYIYTRGVGRLTVSAVVMTPEIMAAEDESVVETFNLARLNNQGPADDNDWHYFSLLLDAGTKLPEDDLSIK